MKTVRKKGSAKKFLRVFVFRTPLTQIHLPEVCGKFGLQVAPCGNILVRIDHFPPGFNPRRIGCVTFQNRGNFAPLGPHLLIETHSQKLHLHLFQLGHFIGRRYG